MICRRAWPVVSARVNWLVRPMARSRCLNWSDTPARIMAAAGLPEMRCRAVIRAATPEESQDVRAVRSRTSRITLEQLHKQMKAGEVKELPIILKADVGGSAEVLTETLQKLSNDKVKVRVIHSGVGAINESDILLASASNAI